MTIDDCLREMREEKKLSQGRHREACGVASLLYLSRGKWAYCTGYRKHWKNWPARLNAHTINSSTRAKSRPNCRTSQSGSRPMTLLGAAPARKRVISASFAAYWANLKKVTSDALLASFVRHRVAVATSVYADAPELQDVITQTPGSHKRTLTNIERLLSEGVPV